MHILSRIFIFILFFVSIRVSSQESIKYTHELKDFNTALTLYKANQYASAQALFKKVNGISSNQEVKADCAYYNASCSIQLDQPNSDVLMERFVADYPTSLKSNRAFIDVAHYYFEQGIYDKAIIWFEKVNESELSHKERDEFNFQKGYAFFTSKKVKEATSYFNKVLNSPEFGSQAKYYLGFMAYEGDNYKEATKYFDEVASEDKYKDKLTYYQADMNFKLGNFQKAIDQANQAMVKATATEKSELSKIIGESYFNLKEYEQATPFLEEYKGNKGRWNNTDYYQLGYVYYKQNLYEKAISQFNKIINGKDFVAQNAFYHLGESYLKLDQKQPALNAFKNASEMSFDENLQEDAALNYAKLSYEIGNSYQTVSQILIDFLKKYPNNPNQALVEKLLIDSYISSKNYKEALVILEKTKGPINKLAYQKVTFFRGLELYSDSNFQEAIALFKKSLSNPIDKVFTARALFWKAETEYVLNDYSTAVLSYKEFENSAAASTVLENKNINYNLAYTYFKLKDYHSASTYFQNQIDTGTKDKARLNDTYLRLGDCLFAESKYWPALESYNKIINLKGLDSDYAQYQKALCYGFLSKNDKKIDELNALLTSFPKSNFRDEATYELANTYLANNDQSQALKTFDKLIKEFKDGKYTSKSILKQGLIYYNTDKSELALTKFKEVVVAFPKTQEALDAVATAKLIYLDSGRVSEYAAWIKTLDFISVSDLELDNDSYGAAYKQYEQNNNKQAISSFAAYIASFPKGVHSLDANYYLAQVYFSDNQKNKALLNYQYVLNEPRSEYTEQALARTSQIMLENNQKENAIPVLLRLETESDLFQNKVFAQSNLMKCYYIKKDYGKAVTYAEKVITNPKSDEVIKSDAQIIIARSAFQNGDLAKAKSSYAKVLTSAKGELAAEALYYEAYFTNKDGNFEASNNTIQKLAKNYSSYRLYGAKGLVLMAKNFYGLKDSYQATYILESVINNFTDFPEVLSDADRELKTIKTEEAKTNSSITE